MMIDIFLAVRAIGGQLLLAPCFLVAFIVVRIRIHQMLTHIREMPETARQVVGYKIGSYVVALLFLVMFAAWISLIFATRFNWRRADVGQIEVVVRRSPDPAAQLEQVVMIQDGPTLSRVFDCLEALRPYRSAGHEHAVGKSYILRLQRKTDGEWSRYRVKVYPDAEPTGGKMRMVGISHINLDIDTGPVSLNLGDYQSRELSEILKQVAPTTSEGDTKTEEPKAEGDIPHSRSAHQ